MSDKLVVSDVRSASWQDSCAFLVNSFSVLPSFCQENVLEILELNWSGQRDLSQASRLPGQWISCSQEHLLEKRRIESQRMQFGRGHYADEWCWTSWLPAGSTCVPGRAIMYRTIQRRPESETLSGNGWGKIDPPVWSSSPTGNMAH